MTHMLDSDVVIDCLARRPDIVACVGSIERSDAGVCAMAYGEVLEGCIGQSHEGRIRADLKAFLQGRAVVPIGMREAERFAEIRRELRAKGRIICDPDILIAATALVYGATLVTRNREHFARIPDLKLLVP